MRVESTRNTVNPGSGCHHVALVTGTAGFIGSHLAEHLLRKGYHVVGVDCLTDYYPRLIKEQNVASLLEHERFTFIRDNLLDLDLVSLLKGRSIQVSRSQESRGDARELFIPGPVEYVFHLAAQPGVRASWGDSFEPYLRNNLLATQQLLEAARQVSLRKLVFASSSSVYGDAETFPTSEDTIPRPVSPYGVTKLAAEHLCLLYWHNFGVPAICLRYFTVYGPRQRPDMAFHRFIRAMLEEQGIVVYGNGEQSRDFTYVDDVVEATVEAGCAEISGLVLNVGNGSRATVNQAIQVIEDLVGRQAQVKYLGEQPGDVRHTGADITRARSVLGFQPKTSLLDGLRAEVQWFLKNVDSLKKVHA